MYLPDTVLAHRQAACRLSAGQILFGVNITVMRTIHRHTRPNKFVFCLLLTFTLLLLTVFAAVPENGVNTPMLGSDHSMAERGNTRNRSGDQGAANAVTDAAGAVGNAVSEAGDAAGEMIGDVGDAAGELVSDAGNAIGNAADAIGGTVGGNTADGNTAGGNNAATNGTDNNNTVNDNNNNQATPFDTHAVDDPAGTAGTVTTNDAPSGMNWVLILILVAAAAAIFFLILMPRRSREM